LEKKLERIHDLFCSGSCVERRIFRDYDKLAEAVAACRTLGLRIVLTSGTFDLSHVGHDRYLEKARSHGDLLLVGVDSDEKTKDRKGPNRPMVGEEERTEILCHKRHVDIVFLKQKDDAHLQLVRTVQPDTLVLSSGSERTEEEMGTLRELCGQVVVLEPQATTSTTARIRRVLVGPAKQIKERLRGAVDDVYTLLDEVTGDGRA
jgi:rfaE bifunctional protein nucleotidyltransferase chain/domain